jgi:hypothetical protein
LIGFGWFYQFSTKPDIFTEPAFIWPPKFFGVCACCCCVWHGLRSTERLVFGSCSASTRTRMHGGRVRPCLELTPWQRCCTGAALQHLCREKKSRRGAPTELRGARAAETRCCAIRVMVSCCSARNGLNRAVACQSNPARPFLDPKAKRCVVRSVQRTRQFPRVVGIYVSVFLSLF